MASPVVEKCRVCKSTLLDAGRSTGVDGRFFSCPLCGKFGLTGTAMSTVPLQLSDDPNSVAVFSHYLRRMQMTEEWPLINSDVGAKIIKEGVLPTPREQADNLIRWLGDNSSEPGANLELDPDIHRSIVGAKSAVGFLFVIQGLEIDGSIEAIRTLDSEVSARLTFDGWSRYEALRQGAPSGRVAFLAMQYGDAKLDQVVNDHFRPAVLQTGFTLKRLDDTPKAGLIDDRLRVEIQGARFLIADLSHGNKGAFWEAGYAEGLGKPVIYTCEKSVFDQVSHFDTNHHLTVLWTLSTIADAAVALKATIRASIPEAKRSDD